MVLFVAVVLFLSWGIGQAYKHDVLDRLQEQSHEIARDQTAE